MLDRREIALRLPYIPTDVLAKLPAGKFIGIDVELKGDPGESLVIVWENIENLAIPQWQMFNPNTGEYLGDYEEK